jgi:hypothetical protein
MQTTNAKQPDAQAIMELARSLGLAMGTQEYTRVHTELEQAVYTALHRPASIEAARLTRKGLEGTLAGMRANMQATLDLVRRATTRMRELHEELAMAEARLAMYEDPAPLSEIHGAVAANADQARAAA